jgi:hypothetical protein
MIVTVSKATCNGVLGCLYELMVGSGKLMVAVGPGVLELALLAAVTWTSMLKFLLPWMLRLFMVGGMARDLFFWCLGAVMTLW